MVNSPHANSVYNDPKYRALVARVRAKPHPCRWCGAVADTVDHLVPVSSGRPAHELNTPANLVPACQGCNTRRGNALRDGRPFVPAYSSGW